MTGAGAMEVCVFLSFLWRTVPSDTASKVGTGLTICHEISRIANTGVLANVMAKCVSFW